MKIFKIVEKRNLWFSISIITILMGVGLMFSRSMKAEPILNYGIDFLGGTSMLLKFDDALLRPTQTEESGIQLIEKIRSVLHSFELEKSSIQITQDKEVFIKTLQLKSEKSQEILGQLNRVVGPLEILEIDYIGPTIGKELKEKSLLIILFIVVFLLAYISIRFQWGYGYAAIIALIHDALITLSFAAILQIEINTAFVASLLTVLGYSINDTIVIFDRIRENQKNLIQETLSPKHIVNMSLSQTMIRTLNTSLTTIIVISSLIFFGGTTIKAFCLVLLIGILSGTYSSLFIASPIVAATVKRNV